MTSPLEDALSELATVTDWLKASLLPTNHQLYRPQMTEDRRDDLEQERHLQQLRDQHLEQKTRRGQYALEDLPPLGYSPVPFDVEVLDLLFEICEFAASHCLLPRQRRDEDDPGPYLDELLKLLRQGRLDADHTVIEDRCEDIVHRALRKLGIVEDGMTLKTVCPWCRGITPRHPEGGQHTLRIRAKLPQGKRSAVTVNPRDIDWLVVCESGGCEPPSKDCGTWWKGRPAWRLASEGDFLAKHLEKAAAAS